MHSRIFTSIALSLAAVLFVGPMVSRTAVARNPNLRIPKIRRVSELAVELESAGSTLAPGDGSSVGVKESSFFVAGVLATIVKEIRIAHETFAGLRRVAVPAPAFAFDRATATSLPPTAILCRLKSAALLS